MLLCRLAGTTVALTASAIIARMSESTPPTAPNPGKRVTSALSPLKTTASANDAMICERCGQAEMYRMHAVWRCPNCGFKTDCCGW